MLAAAWIMAGLIVLAEVMSVVNRRNDLGWLGLLAAGVGLAVAVTLIIRLDETSGFHNLSTVLGVLMWALPVLIIARIFPDFELITIQWTGGEFRFP